jgi:hypothetical protein
MLQVDFAHVKFKPMDRYGIWNKVSLISLEGTDGLFFYHHPTTECMESAKEFQKQEISNRLTNSVIFFYAHGMLIQRTESRSLEYSSAFGWRLKKRGLPMVGIYSFVCIEF